MTPTERLERLVEILDVVTETQFSMSHWRLLDATVGEGKCGMICCAGGWACADPVLQAEGLEMCGIAPALRREGKREAQYGYDAMQVFFGLTLVQTHYIFSPDTWQCDSRDVTPAMVQQRIRDVLAVGDLAVGGDESYRDASHLGVWPHQPG